MHPCNHSHGIYAAGRQKEEIRHVYHVLDLGYSSETTTRRVDIVITKNCIRVISIYDANTLKSNRTSVRSIS